MKSILILITWLVAGPVLSAGPFGLSMGQPASEIAKGTEKKGSLAYYVTEVPSPNSRFEQYALMISNKHGLGKVIGIGNTVVTNPHGDQIRREFESLLEIMTKKYGQPKITDFLRSGSIWSSPEDWMMGMLKKERFFVAIWSGTPEKPLPDDLDSIALDISCLGTDKAYIKLAYEFKNWGAIVDEEKAKEKDSL